MKKVKIYRLSIGGYFLGNELELCKQYCIDNNCTYREGFIYV